MSPRKRKPKIGDLIKVDWIDAAGYVNREVDEAKVPKVWNLGVLIEVTNKYYKLQTGGYSGENFGDYTVIPKDWSEKVAVLLREGEY